MQNKRGTIPPVRCRISSASCGADSDLKWPQVTTGFVPFKICSHIIIQTFANSVDTFMPFSAICDVQFPTPSHILNEYSFLYYYICPTNVQYILTMSQISTPSSVPFKPSHWKLYKYSKSVTQYNKIDCSVSSLHSFIAIYHNILMQH